MFPAQALLPVGQEAEHHGHAEKDQHDKRPDSAGDREELLELRLEARFLEHLAPALWQRVKGRRLARALLYALERKRDAVFASLYAAHGGERLEARDIDIARHDDFGKGLGAAEVLGLEKRKHHLAPQVALRRDCTHRGRLVVVEDEKRKAVDAL